MRPSKPTIALSMIARDRETQLRTALASVYAHVDEIVVVDAGGSVDGTREVARSFGARVIDFLPSDHPEAFYLDSEERFAKYGIPGPFTDRYALADFSAPRNLGFSECKSDLIFWIDSDDIVKGADVLHTIGEKMVEENLETVFAEYQYERDGAGNCTVKQIRERIIWREDFQSGKIKWHQPIHEHMKGMKKGGLFPDVVIIHDTTSTNEGSNSVVSDTLNVQTVQRDKVRFRNLKNLLVEMERAEAAGEEMEARMYFYLGSEYRNVDIPKAEEYLTKYIGMSGWDEERGQARFYLGQIREMQSRPEEAWNLYSGAALDFAENPASWFGLARIAFLRGQWNRVIEFSEKGFAQVNNEGAARKPALVLQPIEWTYRAHLPYSRALIEMGRIEDARKSCETGLKVNPECRFLNEHLKMIEDRVVGREEKAA